MQDHTKIPLSAHYHQNSEDIRLVFRYKILSHPSKISPFSLSSIAKSKKLDWDLPAAQSESLPKKTSLVNTGECPMSYLWPLLMLGYNWQCMCQQTGNSLVPPPPMCRVHLTHYPAPPAMFFQWISWYTHFLWTLSLWIQSWSVWSHRVLLNLTWNSYFLMYC